MPPVVRDSGPNSFWSVCLSLLQATAEAYVSAMTCDDFCLSGKTLTLAITFKCFNDLKFICVFLITRPFGTKFLLHDRRR